LAFPTDKEVEVLYMGLKTCDMMTLFGFPGELREVIVGLAVAAVCSKGNE